MRTKATFFALCLACSMGAQAQEYNLFHDVDADGWLWFDTDEKIEKYVGLCDEENYCVDPNGKVIQMVYADINPDYPATIADAFYVGAGAGGEIGAEGAHTGAIVTANASANMTANGGGIVVMMPSCSTFSMCLSREGKTYVRMMGSKDATTSFTNYDVISAMYSTVFKPLFRSGVFTWTGIETLTSGNDGSYTLKSDAPIYAYFQSLTKDPIYIHGLRVTTPTNSTVAVSEVKLESSRIFFEGNTVVLLEAAPIQVVGMDGAVVAAATTDRLSLDNLPKGVYTVKVGERARKMVIR